MALLRNRPSPFTPILEGTADPRVVWRDAHCVGLHALEPLRPGHALVVPLAEVDHWLDLPPELAAHLFGVAARLGRAIQAEFRPTKVGLMIAGIKVRHAHLHLVPIDRVPDLLEPSGDVVDGPAAAARLRGALRSQGGGHVAER